MKLYHTPLGPAADAEMSEAFGRLAEAKDESPLLHIEYRELRARRRAGGVVWFDFKQLCGGPRSQNDYLELATQFHTVLLSGVPQMSPRLASTEMRLSPAAAVPPASSTCPRGMAMVCMIKPVAGSHSQ